MELQFEPTGKTRTEMAVAATWRQLPTFGMLLVYLPRLDSVSAYLRCLVAKFLEFWWNLKLPKSQIYSRVYIGRDVIRSLHLLKNRT
jgi:hypothetical protein